MENPLLQFPRRWTQLRRLGLVVLKAVLIPQILFLGVVALTSVFLSFMNPGASSLMTIRRFQGVDVQPMVPVTGKAIPGALKNAMILLEDHNFYTHFGILPGAIKDAMETNQAAGKLLVGGSTITQQLARTLFLSMEKTYFRKILEAEIAITMNFLLPKSRLLDLYLNSIEWGPGIFGAGAAARYYYKYELSQLGLDALYRMAAIITNPVKYNVWNFMGNYQMRFRYKALWN